MDFYESITHALYGINTMEQFVEAYTRCPPIHISAFVEPGATSFFPKP